MTSLRIGIDIGGTFTDFVVFSPDSGNVETFKLLSTPHDPAVAVLQGLEKIIAQHGAKNLTVIHGSTVATNALLERKGARIALVATRGFRDVLQIGRQNRPALYDLFADPPPSLVPTGLRFEVDERVDKDGNILQAMDEAQVDALTAEIKKQNVQSVAVCLLFSFVYPEHEQRIAGKLRAAGLLVSPSSEILPEYREYERASTTAVNAYVSPVLDKYLSHLENTIPTIISGKGAEARLRVMQSNGGNISPAEARTHGVQCILSGPAGGVVGCEYVANFSLSPQQSQLKVITFDMGGTSTDVSLIAGKPQITTESIVGGCPIRIPILDIHTIGAGGGSIARVDAGGALRVGPESAGADPGPACYGRGDTPTVTDANVVLGRIPAEYFLGGQMPLDVPRAKSVLEKLAGELGLSLGRAGLGVVQVANAHMERALRVISVERGHDPRTCTLLSFGGAGGLHAADLARGLGIPHVLVPPLASTLSAFGMLAANVVKDYNRTVMLSGEAPLDALEDLFTPLAARAFQEVQSEGVPVDRIRVERFLDMRYRGQSYELTIPFIEKFASAFHDFHKMTYGYSSEAAKLEIVNIRVRGIGVTEPPPLRTQPLGNEDPADALLETRPVIFDGGERSTPFYRAEALRPGNRIPGPAVVVRTDTTVLIGVTDMARVDGFENLVIEVGK
jgi:N-methylhydantoinase A